MKSKVTIAGHPVHSMVVSFPIAFYTATLACVIAYQVSSDALWFRMGYVANIAGISFAVLAAILGIIDWSLAIPSQNPAKETGRTHMMFNVMALILFSANAWLQSGEWNEIQPKATSAIYLTAFGLFCTITAGFYGWNLVQKHHVGIDMTAEQEKLEPAQPQKYFTAHIKKQA